MVKQNIISNVVNLLTNMETKKIEYLCKFCKHEWELSYQQQAIPPMNVKCPKCFKIGNFRHYQNFFEEQKRKYENGDI